MSQKETQRRRHKVRTPLNYEESEGKKFFLPSLTAPDQAIPLRVMLERFTKGLPVNSAMRTPLYEGEGEESSGINPATLDYADIEEIKKANLENIENLKQQKKADDAEKERRRKEKEDKDFETLRSKLASSDSKVPTDA